MTSVVSERQRLRESFFSITLVVSLIVHLAFISAIVLSPSFPSKKLTFGPVYEVDLVNLPSQSFAPVSSAPISSEITNSLQKRVPVTLKRQEQAAITKSDSTQIQKAIEDVRGKVASAQQSSMVPPAKQEASADPEMASKVSFYRSLIWSRIKSQWALPKGILQKDNLEAIIDVRVMRDGTISRLVVEKSSGNRYFDQSAVKAIRKAGPFPPLPEWITDSSAEFGIRFHSSEFR